VPLEPQFQAVKGAPEGRVQNRVVVARDERLARQQQGEFHHELVVPPVPLDHHAEVRLWEVAGLPGERVEVVAHASELARRGLALVGVEVDLELVPDPRPGVPSVIHREPSVVGRCAHGIAAILVPKGRRAARCPTRSAWSVATNR
jgi:hypothetical protein